MISLSGNETVPMWAIAARTKGRVKENDDDDKRTVKKEVKLLIKHKVRVVYEHVIFLSRPSCVRCLVCVASPLPFEPTILAPP